MTADELIQAARDADARGDIARSEALFKSVLERFPDHPQAHYGLGVAAFRRRRFDEAAGHLAAAQRGCTEDPAVAFALAMVYRQQGDTIAEFEAIKAALVADPYFLPGLIGLGDVLNRLGRRRAAASASRNALRVAGPEAAWPPLLAPALQEARSSVEEHGRELAAFLAERMASKLTRLAPAEVERWKEAGAILAGRSRPYVSQCNRLHVPRLAAVPFFERRQFEWVDALERRTSAVLSEVSALLEAQRAAFHPYIAYEPGVPVNQWAQLNHSERWGSYFLWRDGAPVAKAREECPVTTQTLESMPMADIGGLCPNAMFSRLAPRTRIPPHHGETNARVVVHLPLIVPEGCSYRVGFEWRQWRVGEALIFDDTLEHEARNDSDSERVVLIFDVWNPLLSPGEREMVQAVTAAAREFHEED